MKENRRAEHSAAPETDAMSAWQRGLSAASLMSKQFAPIRYIAEGLVAEGLTLLAGAPKLGKSWWVLNLAVAVAKGEPAFGSVSIEKGDVLYLALEDNQRRLKNRLRRMGCTDAPDNLWLCTDWPDLRGGALDEIEAWVESMNQPTLVIVDVLARVRDTSSVAENRYDVDYRAISGLQQLASRHGIAIVAVHHTRKQVAEDPFDSVSGTRGLTGAADSAIVLTRDKGDRRVVLYGRGRDIPEIETAFEFDEPNGTWRVIGAGVDVGKTEERQRILDVLRAAISPLKAQEVATAVGSNVVAVRKMLNRMAEAGEIAKSGRGLFTCLTCPKVSILDE